MWSFNPLLLRLLGEISPSLPCSHSSRSSALDLDPPLRVGRLRASIPGPDRTGLKEQLLRGLWLTQAVGREGYRGGGGEPAASEAGVMLHQPEAHSAFSRGSCPWIPGPWQWRAAQAPGRAVWTVTCAQSEGCLFILFMVSFAVQKLLSFIGSSLFIFLFISISLGGGSKRILL